MSDDIPVTFVNEVSVCGFLNGNVNLTLSVARFSPDPANKIAPDLVVASRLRMDLYCAQSLRDALTKIIDQNTKPAKAN